MASSAIKTVPAPLTEPDEATPLLATDVASESNASSTRLTRPRATHWPYAALLCGLLSLVADLGDGITAAPEVRLLEMAVCRDYYRIHEPRRIGPPPLSYVPEKYCKVKDIQVELAYLRAVLKILTTVPGLMCTVFFGRLADRWGRRPVLLMGMCGQILSFLWVILVCYFHTIFPVRLVWAAAGFQFLGGGHRVIGAIMNTIIVDVAPEHARTTSFYLLGAAIRITDMLAAVAGSALLERDIWLPYEIATPVLLLSIPICIAMPETLIKSKPAASPSKTTTPARKDSGAAVSSPSEATPAAGSSAAQQHQSDHQGLREKMAAILPSTMSFAFILSPLSLVFLIVFLKTFALASNTLFLQYASAALSWTIAQAGYLLSIKGALSLAVLIGLPVLGRWLTGAGVRRGRRNEVEGQEEGIQSEDEERDKAIGTRMVDVWIARGSLGMLAAGCWCVAGAGAAGNRGPGVMVFGLILLSLGNGITQTMRGLVAHFSASTSSKTRTSRSSSVSSSSSRSSSPRRTKQSSSHGHGSGTGNLYGTLVLFELAAILLGNAAFAALYSAGADLSGGESKKDNNAWLGLPFWVAGIIFFLAMLVALGLPAKDEKRQREE
ncbi:major facilitator superfamily domain-containing protein [Phyllosticta capitalensis]|uniref:major facilitator superfamily domain-containing protein n=1 Tax=Phyllosticta capitalensis TaxID=121624 RepID=UPI003132825D